MSDECGDDTNTRLASHPLQIHSSKILIIVCSVCRTKWWRMLDLDKTMANNRHRKKEPLSEHWFSPFCFCVVHNYYLFSIYPPHPILTTCLSESFLSANNKYHRNEQWIRENWQKLHENTFNWTRWERTNSVLACHQAILWGNVVEHEVEAHAVVQCCPIVGSSRHYEKPSHSLSQKPYVTATVYVLSVVRKWFSGFMNLVPFQKWP